jgi:hypothetical protein
MQAEVHGCGDEAKMKGRNDMKENYSSKNTVFPTKKLADHQKQYLVKKLHEKTGNDGESRLSEFAKKQKEEQDKKKKYK